MFYINGSKKIYLQLNVIFFSVLFRKEHSPSKKPRPEVTKAANGILPTRYGKVVLMY